jgi:hypothetical protein
MTFSSEAIVTLLTAALLVAIIVVVWWNAVGFGLLAGAFAMTFIAVLAGHDGIAIGNVAVMAFIAVLVRRRTPRR